MKKYLLLSLSVICGTIAHGQQDRIPDLRAELLHANALSIRDTDQAMAFNNNHKESLPYPGFLKTKSGKKLIYGVYVQYGYNRDWYTTSNIHITMSNGNDFVLHDAKAHDRADFDDIYTKPIEVTLPQFNFRIGVYLNAKHTRAIDFSYDHIKYIVTDGQVLRVTGMIDGERVDQNMTMDGATFMHLEHTDGGNLIHFSYVENNPIITNKAKDRTWLSSIMKAGFGFNYPRTDFTWRGDRLNNKFHIAGINASAELGLRFYPLKFLFIEGVGKAGWVDYINALADTKTMTGNRVHQQLGYMSGIVTLGGEIHF